MRHGQTAGDDLVGGDVDEKPPSRLFARRPPAVFVSPRARDVLAPGRRRSPRPFRWQRSSGTRWLADEGRPPAGTETVTVATGAKTRERRVDKPQFVVHPRHLMNLDVPRGIGRTRQETSVVLAFRLYFRGHGREVMVLANLHRQPDRQAISANGQSHRLGKAAEVRVQHAAIARNITRRPA